jgi:hypothetical protein
MTKQELTDLINTARSVHVSLSEQFVFVEFKVSKVEALSQVDNIIKRGLRIDTTSMPVILWIG